MVSTRPGWVGGTYIHTYVSRTGVGLRSLGLPGFGVQGKPEVTSSGWPPSTDHSLIWNSNVLCSPPLLTPSCSREPSLDGWSSCMRWTWEWKPGARLVEQKDESLGVSQPSRHPEHLHFRRERKRKKIKLLSYLNPYHLGVFSLWSHN